MLQLVEHQRMRLAREDEARLPPHLHRCGCDRGGRGRRGAHVRRRLAVPAVVGGSFLSTSKLVVVGGVVLLVSALGDVS